MFSLGLINLLGQFIGLRKTFYLVNHQFIIKGYNSESAQGKKGQRGRCAGRGTHLHVLTLLKALRVPSFWAFMDASLHDHNWLNHWPLATDSVSNPSTPSPQRSGSGMEVPAFNQAVVSFSDQTLFLGAFQKSPQPLSPSALGKSHGFCELCVRNCGSKRCCCCCCC